MTWQPVISSEERLAVALLRAKGWQVEEPVCPECGGWGLIGTWTETPEGGEYGYRRCSFGCPGIATLHAFSETAP